MSRPLSSYLALPLIIGFSAMAGCGGVSENVREEVTRTEASVQQVQQSGMTREAGGLELEEAKDKVARARAALEDGDEEEALRLASEARVDADLAQAKAHSARARRAADEMVASIEALRREATKEPQPTWTSEIE